MGSQGRDASRSLSQATASLWEMRAEIFAGMRHRGGTVLHRFVSDRRLAGNWPAVQRERGSYSGAAIPSDFILR